MIRATELAGRAVVDIDAAEKIGSIDKMILDPDAHHVAGFVVTRPGSFPGTRSHVLIPAAAVHAVGPDAVTVKQAAVAGTDTARLDTLPRGTDLIGRKLVSEDGRFLGKVSDILVDPTNGRIAGYLLSDFSPSKKWEEAAGGAKRRHSMPYLPADARIRTGRELLVTSEEAVTYWSDEDATEQPEHTSPNQWAYTAPSAVGTAESTQDWAGSTAADVHPTARTGSELEDLENRDRKPPRSLPREL